VSVGRIAKRCLTHNSLPYRLRLVGTLVLLYGQQASAIARLRRSDVTRASGLVSIRLGRDAVVLDEPLATIAAELAAAAVPDAQPRGIARAFNAEGDGWLFPGRGPGNPLGEAALRQDLTKLQIRTRSGRNTALLALLSLDAADAALDPSLRLRADAMLERIIAVPVTPVYAL
jgi:integrase